MNEFLLAYSVTLPLITKTDNKITKILLHRRQNTGYNDGKWDLAGGGRVDSGETPQDALVRECNEELGIAVSKEDITFAHLSHRFIINFQRVYYDIYFTVSKYTGLPYIREPDKCSELEWFDIDDLPNDLIEQRKMAIQAHKNGIYYSEVIDNFRKKI